MKKIIALLLSAILLFSLVACQEAPKDPDPDKTETIDKTTGEGAMKITVIVTHKDGSGKELTYDTDEEFLGALLQAEGLIQGNDGPYGLEITHVDGEKAVYTEDNAYWALYEGEEYAMQGIDTTPIKDGGVYKLVYTPA